VIGWILSEAFGDVAVDILFGWLVPSRSSKPLPEGDWNASLGALSAFLGLVALLAAGVGIPVLTVGNTDASPAPALAVGAAVCSFLLSYAAFRCGIKTPKVTARNRPLATIGIVLSCAAALISASALAMLAIRGAS
jgi:hypothetical protein